MPAYAATIQICHALGDGYWENEQGMKPVKYNLPRINSPIKLVRKVITFWNCFVVLSNHSVKFYQHYGTIDWNHM